jgi:DNA polymerase III subunit epsilon
MRQIVLDTETTGLEPEAGHRVIEVGCVELVNRRITQNSFHRYINPERPVDLAALEVHGLGDEFLATQLVFAEIADDFLEFVDGAQLVIHNADFDASFIDHELARLTSPPVEIRTRCSILDTLPLARRLHPGQRNSLDALARRYHVDLSKRELHGALLDAQILADVYLAMTGGQASLSLDGQSEETPSDDVDIALVERSGLDLIKVSVSDAEQRAHNEFLALIHEQTGQPAIWLAEDSGAEVDTA